MQKTISGLPLPDLPELVAAGGWVSSGRRRRWLVGAGLLVVASAAWFWWRTGGVHAGAPTVYRTARVTIGNITQTVSATGPLSAIATINVGSQVSGNIAMLHVDFNDRVTAGQLIAEIEPSTYEARLVQAEGDLLVARVALEQKQLNARRSETLHASHLIPQSDHDQALTELHQQEAVVTIKDAAVKSARVDLERTKIRSPIEGVVIDRAIDIGQTVQASFAAPTLFVLAQDLRQMQITAHVSEADIGGVAPDKPVKFTVDAFPGETFSGRVRQVRNNTTTTNNVVTYPTIITLDNPDLKLRPGMTANVTIIVARRERVLRAPNAALRFHPAAGAASNAAAARTLYRIHGDIDPAGRATGALEAVAVQAGLSDAAYTEIVSGVSDGTAVVTGIALTPARGGGAASAATSNPFMPKMPSTGQKR